MTNFVKELQDVVHWNAVANMGENDLSDEAIQRQVKYTQSELRETIKAAVGSDDVEVLDGAGDVFVTLGYLLFMTGLTYQELTDFLSSGEYAEQVAKYNADTSTDRSGDEMVIASYANTLWFCVHPDNFEESKDNLLSDMLDLFALVESTYKVPMTEVIRVVMESNWSKYPLASDILNIEEEVKAIEAQGYKNVRYALVTVDGQERYVFRDAYGVGKIRKPTSYAAPTEKLRALLAAV